MSELFTFVHCTLSLCTFPRLSSLAHICARSLLFSLILLIALSSCSSRSVREAQTVVADADSLWHNGQMYGIDYGDSATLAQAYETLSTFNSPYLQIVPLGKELPTDFSHLCYHYGRLLRKKDNPAEAMQVFINATHSHARDYHILGRVYSNMGSICHLAGEYNLAYDMYERSAGMFLKNRDTINYYYALNDMAFELAEQGMKDETFAILDIIQMKCEDKAVLLKTEETKANVYFYTQQYDSAIYCSKKILQEDSNISISLIICAQAYSYLGKQDSATYYAEKVLAASPSLEDINNALYILINDDASRDVEFVRETAAKRSDTQKFLEIRQGKISQATQLLEQDLQSNHDLWWLYPILITTILVGVFISVYLQIKRRKHKSLSQQIDDLTIQNNILSQLHDAHHMEIVADIEKFCALIRCNQDLQEHLHWNNFTEMCMLSDRYLYNVVTRLQSYNLSPKEIRLCILILLKASTNQMVDMIPYARSGLGKFKYTTANKLGTTTPNLRTFIIGLLG